MESKTVDGKRALYWHYPHYGGQKGFPGGAVREGDWKLIEWYENGDRELFNLREDIGERINVASEQPERLIELRAKLAAWRSSLNGQMPTPNPDYKESVDMKPEIVQKKRSKRDQK